MHNDNYDHSDNMLFRLRRNKHAANVPEGTCMDDLIRIDPNGIHLKGNASG